MKPIRPYLEIKDLPYPKRGVRDYVLPLNLYLYSHMRKHEVPAGVIVKLAESINTCIVVLPESHKAPWGQRMFSDLPSS